MARLGRAQPFKPLIRPVVIATSVNISITQVAATVTFTGGTQAVKTSASIAQVAATITFTGGTPTADAVNDVAVTQSAATLTFAGGTQSIITTQSISIAQVAASITFAGGSAAAGVIVTVAQVAASITFYGNELYKTAILADSPVAYWRLGEASGTLAADSASIHTGTYTGGFTLGQTGAIVNDPDTAVSFNGTTGNVAIVDDNALKITGNISLEAWVKPTGATSGGIISRSDSTNSLEGYGLIYFKSANNYFQFSLGSATTGGSIHGATNSVSANTWYHVVGTWDGANMRLYVNGLSAATPVAYSSAVAVATNAAKIGLLQWAFGPSFFTGAIDEVAVYNSVLSPTQVLNHYNVGITNPIISTVNNVSIAQVAATITLAGGTQAIATVRNVAISQLAAALTFTGGTQLTKLTAAIVQSAATITLTGGTQSVATVRNVAISQLAATITLSGGSQGVQNVQDAQIAQVAATVTFTGGTQAVVAVQKVAITQAHASLTFTGGTQAVLAARAITIAQLAASLTFSGGTQAVISSFSIRVSQVGAAITFSGGVMVVKTTNIIPWVSPSVVLDSGGKSVIVDSGQKFTTAASGAKISEVTSGTKNETIQSGAKTTTVQSGAKQEVL